MIKMKSPKGVESISIGRTVYVPKGGFVSVHPEDVAALRPHGFMTQEDEDRARAARGTIKPHHTRLIGDDVPIESRIEGSGV